MAEKKEISNLVRTLTTKEIAKWEEGVDIFIETMKEAIVNLYAEGGSLYPHQELFISDLIIDIENKRIVDCRCDLSFNKKLKELTEDVKAMFYPEALLDVLEERGFELYYYDVREGLYKKRPELVIVINLLEPEEFIEPENYDPLADFFGLNDPEKTEEDEDSVVINEEDECEEPDEDDEDEEPDEEDEGEEFDEDNEDKID